MAASTPHGAADQRSAERFETTVPVTLEGASGRTHNVSASGVYFETDAVQEPGSRVRFTVELTIGGERRQLQYEGEVVRVQSEGGRIGVAARLAQPFFDGTEVVEALPAPAAPR